MYIQRVHCYHTQLVTYYNIKTHTAITIEYHHAQKTTIATTSEESI